MAKPSLLDGFKDEEKPVEEDGTDEKAAFEELRKRFLEGDPDEAYDAFMGLVSLCDEDEGETPEAMPPGKPILKIHIGHE